MERKPAILASLAAGRITLKLRGDEQKRRRGQEKPCGEWPEDHEAVFRQLHGRRRTCPAKVHDPYRGLPAQQHPSTQAALAELVQSHPPSQIVEIGTSRGGLTWMLRDLAPKAAIRTYDIKPCPNIGLLTSQGIDCRVADPLAAESHQELVEFIRRPATTMILCDGGYKPAELKAVVGIAKPGDIVLAHDYAPNRQVFKSKIRGKRWNWCELTDADLQATGIRPIDLAKLRDAMWFCGVVHSISATATA